jgi:DNA-binding CsgD family transcriptional regulator
MLQQADFKACLDAVHAIASAGAGVDDFARAGVTNLKRLVGAELTTLSICALDDGRRNVVADVPGAISRRDIAAFDRHFDAHPLVREHGRNPGARTQRISDLVPDAEFRNTSLYDEYYRAIGIDHAMAVPIHVDREELVSFVFNRRGRDFDDRERDLLELIRPHLGDLYRMTRAVDDARAAWGVPAPGRSALDCLTEREREVLRWLAGGKTDRDIGEILGISPRTVHKHLQRIYEKLGVETRTAAVVRALAFMQKNP